ncbi:carbohydrate ABC transporter permease [Streptomyces sp. NPDC053741]|uniref:carbohydrate ABC transporter permease n=1 Tax=Streptomyces TaxID=1883 RepID=UPI0004C496EA|nr:MULTISPECIES: carbohydrate ABC transporter permease [unclassified Streptomyces]MDF9874062.1 multiple sugar transport system permease protein [Streptomyces pratensis]MDX2620293.1 carbohydrate ABC transporter permease [Streptomyces sp. WI03-5b]MDX3183607.1 carbohydrate ABC transporter permease [Streptomyces sp. ME02-7008A-1]MDX3304059.1 carbohydrate ABC transporter permease [Streptomyces sp. ME02-7008A]QBR04979.1 carbohydrate ABC transporter permease [Streptomyces sp. S501]
MSGSATFTTRRAPGSGRSADAGGRRPRWTPGRIALLVVALLLTAAWLLPLAWAVATSLKPEGDTTRTPFSWTGSRVTFDAYSKVWESGDLMVWLMNSAYISVMTTLLTVVTCAMAAYGFTRTDFRGRRLLYGLVLAGIMVPPQVLIAPLFREMVQLGLVDTYWGVILPQIAVPAMVFILVKFFEGVPRELEEAAFVDGAGRWRVFWTIVIPLSRPVLAAVAIFTFISTWNNFLWPFLVTTDPGGMTLPVGLVNVQSTFGVRYAQIMASLVIAGLPLLIVFAFFQRQIVRGIAHTGLAGQ